MDNSEVREQLNSLLHWRVLKEGEELIKVEAQSYTVSQSFEDELVSVILTLTRTEPQICPECDGTGIDESRYVCPSIMPQENDYSCLKCKGTGKPQIDEKGLLEITVEEADKCRGWAGQRRQFILGKLKLQAALSIRLERAKVAGEIIDAYESMLDGMGLGESNFKVSDWGYKEQIIAQYKEEGNDG